MPQTRRGGAEGTGQLRALVHAAEGLDLATIYGDPVQRARLVHQAHLQSARHSTHSSRVKRDGEQSSCCPRSQVRRMADDAGESSRFGRKAVPRGVTQWVRNLRVAGEGQLRLGGHTEPFHAVEIADSDKRIILRSYLRRWKWEVGMFFDGVGPDSSDAEIDRIAPDHPIFLITGA
jgi:hypothetical protein